MAIVSSILGSFIVESASMKFALAITDRDKFNAYISNKKVMQATWDIIYNASLKAGKRCEDSVFFPKLSEMSEILKKNKIVNTI